MLLNNFWVIEEIKREFKIHLKLASVDLWLSVGGPMTQEVTVRFSVRAHAQVAVWIPAVGGLQEAANL